MVVHRQYSYISAPRSVFPYAKYPRYAITDIPWRYGRWGLKNAEGILADVQRGCVLPAPKGIKTNNILKENVSVKYNSELALALMKDYDLTLPEIRWDIETGEEVVETGSLYPRRAPDTSSPMYIDITRVPAGTTYHFKTVEENPEERLDMFPCQVAEININYRSCPRSSNLPGNPPTSEEEEEVTATFKVAHQEPPIKNEETGEEEDPQPKVKKFHVVQKRDRVFIRSGDSDMEIISAVRENWKAKLEDKPEAGPLDQPLNVELRVIYPLLEFIIGGENYFLPIDIYFAKAKEGALYISGLEVKLKNVERATFMATPKWWPLDAQCGEREFPIGFRNENVEEPMPVWNIEEHKTNKRWKARVYPEGDLYGPLVKYDLNIEYDLTPEGDDDDDEDEEEEEEEEIYHFAFNEGTLTRYCRPFRMLLIRYNEELVEDEDIPQSVYPVVMNISHSFDRDSLTISSMAQLTFNSARQNWPGDISAAQRFLFSGLSALTIDLERDPDIPPSRVFTGLLNTSAGLNAVGGQMPTVSVTALGRQASLMAPRWGLPWMDGWNLFYAMGFLANLGGIAIDDMLFAPLIPETPFEDLGDGHGNPAYFLPIGPATGDLTRFSGQSLWGMMQKLAKMVGYCLFFDVEGKLYFDEYKEPEGVKRTFYEDEVRGCSLNACWALSVNRELLDMRNETILIGPNIGAYKIEPRVFKAVDDRSIDDPTAFNYLGFRNPSVYVDSLFVTEDFIDQAGRTIHRVERIPPAFINLTTWLSPDIYPLDTIEVVSDRFGTTGTRFLVVGVQHYVDPNQPYTTISAELTIDDAPDPDPPSDPGEPEPPSDPGEPEPPSDPGDG